MIAAAITATASNAFVFAYAPAFFRQVAHSPSLLITMPTSITATDRPVTKEAVLMADMKAILVSSIANLSSTVLGKAFTFSKSAT